MQKIYDNKSILEQIQQLSKDFKKLTADLIYAHSIDENLNAKSYVVELDDVEKQSLQNVEKVIAAESDLVDTIQRGFHTLDTLTQGMHDRYESQWQARANDELAIDLWEATHHEEEVTPDELAALTGIPGDYEQEVTNPNEFESIFDTDDEPEL